MGLVIAVPIKVMRNRVHDMKAPRFARMAMSASDNRVISNILRQQG